MKKENQIRVQVDHMTLDVVFRSLTILQENFHKPGAIDKSAFMVDNDELADVIKLLEPHISSGDNQKNITMTLDQWSVYSHTINFVSRVGNALPVSATDLDRLDGLASAYYEWEEVGFPSSGPV